MVVVPAGSTVVNDADGQHEFALPHPIAVSLTEITVEEFAAFVRASEYQVGVNCRTYEGGRWDERFPRDFGDPGFAQHQDEPAVCLTWFDARAYVAWLNGNLGVSGYRLPTEAEWRYLNAAHDRRLRGVADGAAEWSGECARTSSHPPGACVLRERLGGSWPNVTDRPDTEASPLMRDSATGFRVVRDMPSESER